jgi:rhodanese-related sulfurtransferase
MTSHGAKVTFSETSLPLLVLKIVLIGQVDECLCGEADNPKQEKQAQIIEGITPGEAFELIQKNKDNPNFVILDVRTPKEFAEGHIKEAINLDYYSETFKEELNKLDKNKTYLIHCRSGNRSGKTLSIMKGLNFREVYDMLGGMNEWKAEGLPTTK